MEERRNILYKEVNTKGLDWINRNSLLKESEENKEGVQITGESGWGKRANEVHWKQQREAADNEMGESRGKSDGETRGCENEI